MTQRLHNIFTPAPPPEPTIYEVIIGLVEDAEEAADTGHPVEALIMLGTAKSRLQTYLSEMAN